MNRKLKSFLRDTLRLILGKKIITFLDLLLPTIIIQILRNPVHFQKKYLPENMMINQNYFLSMRINIR